MAVAAQIHTFYLLKLGSYAEALHHQGSRVKYTMIWEKYLYQMFVLTSDIVA